MVELERFLSKFVQGEGCWLWTGRLDGGGYGDFWHSGRYSKAHRYSYEVLVGPIPDGMQLDHLCRTRHCVRPDHLEPVTQAENIRRGVNHERAKTHCSKGHTYDEANTYLAPHRTMRNCRTCNREAQRRARARRAELSR